MHNLLERASIREVAQQFQQYTVNECIGAGGATGENYSGGVIAGKKLMSGLHLFVMIIEVMNLRRRKDGLIRVDEKGGELPFTQFDNV